MRLPIAILFALVLLNGQLAAQSWSEPVSQPWTFADLDGDSDLELVVTQVQGHSGGLRAFTPRVAPTGSWFPSAALGQAQYVLRVRDADADKDLDIFLVDAFSRKELSWWENKGQGRFVSGNPRQMRRSSVPAGASMHSASYSPPRAPSGLPRSAQSDPVPFFVSALLVSQRYEASSLVFFFPSFSFFAHPLRGPPRHPQLDLA
ncbi:MAG: hypothetical protein OHK0021_13150 [Bryobacter sp.]